MLGFAGVTKIKKEDGTRADLEFAIAMLDADGNEKVSWGEFREAFLGPLTEEPEDPSASARESTCPNHAIDATPARWRGGPRSSPLDGASTAAPSPRNDLVKNYRAHPTHWLISTQPVAGLDSTYQ